MSIPKKSHATKKHDHPRQQAPALGSLFQSAMFGALIGILCATLLLFVATVICYATADPCAFTTPAALSALYLASFASGFAAIRHHRSMALACGALSGIALLLVFLMISIILRSHTEETFSALPSFFLRLGMIPVSAIGAYIGLPKKHGKKRHVR